MAARYFNWKLAIVLLVGVVVFAGAAFALREWRRSARAEEAQPLGNIAYERQDWDEAAAQFGRYLAVNGDDWEVLLKYAEAQLKRRPLTRPHVQQAVAAYRAVLRHEEASPQANAEAANSLAELYINSGVPGEAELVAKAYLEEHEDPNLRRLLGVALAQQRKFQEAEKTLSEVVRNDPSRVRIYELLGRLAQSRPEDFNRPAAEWFDEMVRMNPQSCLAYAARAEFRLRSGDPNGVDAAMADLELAQQQGLSDTGARLQVARLLIQVGALDKAREDLEALETAVQDEESLLLWLTWAELALRSGAADEMADVAAKGLEHLAPQPWDFMPVAAELFIRAGRSEKARQCTKQMRERDLGLSRVAFLEGLLANAEGKPREAAAHWQDAIEQGYTDHPSPLRLSGVPLRLMLASALSQLGDLQSAAGQLQTLTSEAPMDVRGHLTLAELHRRMGDWPAVREEAREVLRLVPEHRQAALLEAQARMALLTADDTSAEANADDWKNLEDRLAALAAEPKGSTIDVGLLRVQVALRQDKLDEAANLLSQLKSEHPSDPRPVLLEAQLLVAKEDIRGAIELLRGAIERFPQTVEPVQPLALLLNQQGDREQCESVVRDAMARMDRASARQSLGLFLADLYGLWAQEDKRYQWLTDLEKQFPNDVRVKRSLLALPALRQNQPKAQTLVDEIKSIEGEDGWQWRLEQARVWIDSNDFDALYPQVTTLLRENLLSNPDDQTSRLLLGAAHEKAGRLQLAISVYRDALNRWPDNVLIVARTVAALQEADRLGEAQEILDDAERRDLKHPDLDKLESYGQRFAVRDHLRAGRLESASDVLKELVRQDPNDVSAGLQLAWIMMRQGKLDEAEVFVREVESKLPPSVSLASAQVELEMRRGNTEKALQLCHEAVNDFGSASAYWLRARTHAALKADEEAIADYSRAIELDPSSPGPWAVRAEFFRSLGRTSEAIADVKKALSLSPESLPIQKLALEMYLTSGSRTLRREAETMLDDALQAHPEDVDLKMIKIRVLLSRRTRASLEQVESMLAEVTDAEPTRAEAWQLLGRLRLQEGEAGSALDMALRGLAHNHQDKELLLLKADAEAERYDSPVLAVPTLRQLAESYPNDVTIEMRLAEALYWSGKKGEAIALLEDRMHGEPNSPAPLIALAGLFSRDQRWAELSERITQWFDKNPDDVTARAGVAGRLIGSAANHSEAANIAESLLQEVLQRDPTSVGALSVLAALKQTTQQVEEAAVLNRRILAEDPNNVVAINNLAWVLCEEKGQYQEALELAERGLRIAPDYVDLIDTRGVIHYRMGATDETHYEKAVVDFERCVELFLPRTPSLAPTRFHLARVYAKTGRKTEAVQQLKEAIDLNDDVGGLSPENLAEARKLLGQLEGES
jgi:tetratricopeptide (TPR) repeat protein